LVLWLHCLRELRASHALTGTTANQLRKSRDSACTPSRGRNQASIAKPDRLNTAEINELLLSLPQKGDQSSFLLLGDRAKSIAQVDKQIRYPGNVVLMKMRM